MLLKRANINNAMLDFNAMLYIPTYQSTAPSILIHLSPCPQFPNFCGSFRKKIIQHVFEKRAYKSWIMKGGRLG